MEVIDVALGDVKLIAPKVFGDERGYFMETFREQWFREHCADVALVQDNHSLSQQGTLRGLHYQTEQTQGKLVRVIAGEVFDVAVDIRKESPTFGDWFGIELTAQNKKQLLIPKGFAHGFMTLTENVEVQYKVDELYAPECERGIIWNDPTIGINWPMDVQPILSGKDEKAPLLKDAENNFSYRE